MQLMSKNHSNGIIKDDCPSGSERRGQECCLPVIEGSSRAGTAEALMRSRYTAYALKNSDYLLRSWHPDYRPASISFVSNQKWLGLKIKSVQDGGLDSDKGTVEFIARFKVSGRAERLHEVSRFEKQDDHWLYCDGELLE